MADTWIILGATSTIARLFARKAAANGNNVVLAGRDMEDIAATAADCIARGAPIAKSVAFDARDPKSFEGILTAATEIGGILNAAVFVGSMPPQDEIDSDPSLIDGTVADSYTGPARFLHMLAPLMEEHGAGTVVGVGSVAGDRGRLGNYVYGSTKAGFHTYLSGLRNRLTRSGCHVVTVKPGTVDTAMTWGMDGLPLLSTPQKVVDDIFRAVEKKRNVIYTPGIWAIIMTIIRLIPEPIFKKMKI